MGSMDAALLMTSRVVLVLNHGYSRASGFGDIERRAIAAEYFDGRPFRQNRERWRSIRAEFFVGVNNIPAYDCQHGFDMFDILLRNSDVIICEHGEVSKLTRDKGAFFARLAREP